MAANGQPRVMFPGEPHLGNILLRAAVAGKKGIEVRVLWSRSAEEYVGGDDYALLHEFGYLGDLKTWRNFKGSINERMYAHLTPRGRRLLDWAAGKRREVAINKVDDPDEFQDTQQSTSSKKAGAA